MKDLIKTVDLQNRIEAGTHSREAGVLSTQPQRPVESSSLSPPSPPPPAAAASLPQFFVYGFHRITDNMDSY